MIGFFPKNVEFLCDNLKNNILTALIILYSPDGADILQTVSNEQSNYMILVHI